MKLNPPLPALRLSPWPNAGPLLRHGSLHVAAALLLVWAASNFLVPRLGWGVVELYVLQPLLWLALFAFVVWRWRRDAPAEAFPRPQALLLTGLLLGALQVAVGVLLGLMFGFGQSTLARQWPLVLLNLWYAGTQLAGFELARWYFVRGLSRRSMGVAVGVAWPLFALLSVAPGAYSRLATLAGGLPFVGRDLLPAFAQNLLATYLAALGGPLPALLYRGLPVLFEWVAPILPQLSWLAAAFAGTLLPILGLILVSDNYLPGGPAVADPAARTDLPAARPTGQTLAGWVFLALLAVALLWFNTGLFGIRPSLVSGYSMKPTFMLGDLVISREVPLDTLAVGDIVRYRLNNVDVVHRITAIQTGADGQVLYTTRGDNNNTDDAPVTAEQIQGQVILVIPKLGWPAVGLRLLLAQVLAVAGGGVP